MTVQKAKLTVMRAVRNDQRDIAEHLIDAGLTLQIAHAEILNHGPYTKRMGSGEITKRLVRVKVTFRLWHAESDTFEDITALAEAADEEDGAVAVALERAYRFAMRTTFFLPETVAVSVVNIVPPVMTNETGGVRLAVVENADDTNK